MKIQIMSDLHLEFARFEASEVDTDVVVLAGDIWKGARGIGWARDTFDGKEIIYVPGNHEFYGEQRADALDGLRKAASECGVHLLDNDEVIIAGVRFLGSTLWTDFELHGVEAKPLAMVDGSRYLNDFRAIREGSAGRFSPQDSILLHQSSLAWLTAKLEIPFAGKTVVVTHHLPSMLSVADRYKDSLLSACFASNLDHIFGRMNLWVHGHTHDNFDYVEKGTRVICNPRGYVNYGSAENYDFDPTLVVEI